MIPIEIKCNFDPKKEMFILKFGKQYITIDPIQFTRIVEYFDTILTSYITAKHKE